MTDVSAMTVDAVDPVNAADAINAVNPAAHLASMLLADGRLPTGGYAHSATLEPAIVAGLDVNGVPDYLRTRIGTVALVEAAGVVLARRRAHEYGRVQGHAHAHGESLQVLQQEMVARTPSEAMRHASAQLARGYTRLAQRLFPDSDAVAELVSIGRDALRPIAFGVLAGELDLGDREAARLSLYGDAQTAAAAALKLLPVDPVDTVHWLLEVAPAIDEAVSAAVAVDNAAELPAFAAPMIEQYAFSHDHRTRRIFVA